jgi:hypothetical protein
MYFTLPMPSFLQERCLELLPRLNAWLEGWSCSLAGAGLSPEQLLTFSNAKSEFWLYLVEMLSKLTEHPDLQVSLIVLISE